MSAPRPAGFFSNMTNEQLKAHIGENYHGQTISDVAHQCRSAYNLARERRVSDEKSILDELVEAGVLRRTMKPQGFYKNMTDGQMIEYVKQNFSGETMENLREKDGTVYGLIQQRKLVEKLAEDNILIVSRKPNGYFSSMTNKELKNYVAENFSGRSPADMKGSSAYNVILEREGLMDSIVADGILIRKSKPSGFFKGMTNKQLRQYVVKNYQGKPISAIQKDENGLYNIINERRMIDKLVKAGILLRMRKPNGYFRDMSANELKSYIRENHHGVSVSALGRRDGQAYADALEKEIVDDLVKEGVLKRKGRGHGFIAHMSDEQLKEHIRANHKGRLIKELQKKDASAFNHAYRRKLIVSLVKEGTLRRKGRPKGFFANMTDEQMIEFVRENYSGMKIVELQKKDGAVYHTVSKREGLIDELVKSGILIRFGKPKGFFANMTNEQVISYVRENYSGKPIKEVDSAAYQQLLHRKSPDGKNLVDKLVEEGVLIRGMRHLRTTNLLEDIAGGAE